ncbi:mitochondrial transcription factor 2 [Coemansia sp. RSA 2598]|nr:mitochondrial transcription factor 2 [Coemansia sp. RSA 2598]
MAIESLRLLAELVCVATNAYPRLSEELLMRATGSESEQAAAPGILEVLRLHGGERFGEKDNTNELSVLQKWIDHCIGSSVDSAALLHARETPSFHDLFDGLLAEDRDPRFWSPAVLSVGEIELVKDGRRVSRLGELLAQKWTRREPKGSIPSLLFVKGPLAVSTLGENACVDFVAAAGTDNEHMLRQEQLEKTQISYSDCQNVLKSIGVVEPHSSCDGLLQSLLAVRKWISLVTKDRAFEQWKDALEDKCPSLVSELSSESSVWEAIIARANILESDARRSLEALERRPKYVLRAFIARLPLVDDKAPTSNGDRGSRVSYAVVRRFGKTEGASHYSVLASDGACWPTRIQDIRGTVVESLWVCCNDDNECIAGAAATAAAEAAAATVESGASLAGCSIDSRASQGTSANAGMNTVVADPDDDIYCDVCLDLNSFSYDQIIICDKCERGVHQMCHVPIVTEDEVTQDQWFCSKCRPKKAAKSLGVAKRPRTQ